MANSGEHALCYAKVLCFWAVAFRYTREPVREGFEPSGQIRSSVLADQTVEIPRIIRTKLSNLTGGNLADATRWLAQVLNDGGTPFQQLSHRRVCLVVFLFVWVLSIWCVLVAIVNRKIRSEAF